MSFFFPYSSTALLRLPKGKGFKGFTLVEILLALLILSSGLIVLTSSWGGSFARIKRLNTRTMVYNLIQQKMAEIEKEYENSSLSTIPEILEGDIEGHPGVRWRMESRFLEFPDLASLLTAQEGGTQAAIIYITQKVQEYLQKGVKEIRVSLLLPQKKGQKKPQIYSLSTYFVEYNSFSLPQLDQLEQFQPSQ